MKFRHLSFPVLVGLLLCASFAVLAALPSPKPSVEKRVSQLEATVAELQAQLNVWF